MNILISSTDSFEQYHFNDKNFVLQTKKYYAAPFKRFGGDCMIYFQPKTKYQIV